MLPTEKSSPSITPEKALILLYADPKVGKSTLAAGMDVDHTLVLATEPGTGGLEAYVHEVKTWEEFLNVLKELAKGQHHFKTVSVDSADALYAMCQKHAIDNLNAAMKTKHTYPGDFEYGKGWDAVNVEWRRIAFLCRLGLGVTFTSHAKTEEIERPVGSIIRYMPSLAGSALRILNRYVEFVFFEEVINVGGKDVRVIRSQKSPYHFAGGRFQRPMQDPLIVEAENPLDSGRILREAMAEATAPAASVQIKLKKEILA
jgi:hypothetical protein